jgi:peptidoglycan/xylan/chitin deacetylase (PgdA/CDA1 family)
MFDLTLTFDNGPEPDITPPVLDALRERGILATFFVIGEKLKQNRSLVEAAHAKGHWIGNHTWTHGIPLGDRVPDQGAIAEVLDTQRELGALAHPDKLFRPFADGALGSRLLNAEAARLLHDDGYTCVLWNAVPEEWLDPEGWVERALAQCQEQPWTLLVLHDLPTGAMRHLPRFLDRVAELGGRFRQEFPPDCTPIRRGTATMELSSYVSGGWPQP